MSYVEDFIAAVETHEGCISWMYLDTKGNITVGYGKLLATVEEAVELPFRLGADFATRTMIRTEFNRVLAMPVGHVASFYRINTSPLLDQSYMNTLLRKRVEASIAALSRRLNMWGTFPDSVKIGLMDMEYNLGETGLFYKFPGFIAAVREHNWALARKECHRRDVSEERNLWTARMFEV